MVGCCLFCLFFIGDNSGLPKSAEKLRVRSGLPKSAEKLSVRPAEGVHEMEKFMTELGRCNPRLNQCKQEAVG